MIVFSLSVSCFIYCFFLYKLFNTSIEEELLNTSAFYALRVKLIKRTIKAITELKIANEYEGIKSLIYDSIIAYPIRDPHIKPKLRVT